MKFEELNLSPNILKAISELGYEEATPIQSNAIESIQEGKDIVGQSQTGTGKTAAFAIPSLEKVNPANKGIQVLTLCPTRELAIQVNNEYRKLAKYNKSIRTLPVYGGQSIERQIQALKNGVQVVIGTPGRILDHIRRGTLKLNAIHTLILDEADEMLDMGFLEDIESIVKQIDENRQTLLFSATMSKEIMEISNRFLKSPKLIKVVKKELTVPNIEQYYTEVSEHNKMEALCRLLDFESPKLSIVFCNTKRKVDEVSDKLQSRGYFAEALHGDLKQMQRDKVMEKFRNGKIEILVATDVAARGIDVDDINAVFNYDLPQDDEYYVHRIGRTGRAGKSGKAFTFISGRDVYKLRDIVRYSKTKIKPMNLPSWNDIEEIKVTAFLKEIANVIEEEDLNKYMKMAEKLLEEDYSSIEIAAALLKRSLADVSFAEREEIDFAKTKSFDFDLSDQGNPNVRLFLNVGNVNQLRKKDVVGAIAGETGIRGNLIGEILIYDNFTFVDIPKKYANLVLSKMKNKTIKGKRINVEKAKFKK